MSNVDPNLGEQPASGEELTTSQAAQAIFTYAAGLMRDGLTNEQVMNKLTEKGLDRETASTVVSQLDDVRNEQENSAAKRNMGIGALMCIVGIAVTVFTMQVASEGGTYVVAWGAILFGAIQFLRGLSQLKT